MKRCTLKDTVTFFSAKCIIGLDIAKRISNSQVTGKLMLFFSLWVDNTRGRMVKEKTLNELFGISPFVNFSICFTNPIDLANTYYRIVSISMKKNFFSFVTVKSCKKNFKYWQFICVNILQFWVTIYPIKLIMSVRFFKNAYLEMYWLYAAHWFWM